MNIELLIIFIILNAVNVVIQTVKSLCTIKGGKLVAASANAIAYGLYTVVVIFMVCDLPLFWKVVIVGLCNFVGVFAVKWLEEKARKDKLWKVEVTVPANEVERLKAVSDSLELSYNYVDIQKYALFNFYCLTQSDSTMVKNMLENFNAKYFVSESKTL